MKTQEQMRVKEIIQCMHCYQKENRVVRRCMDNSQTLLNILRNSKIKGAKARACICAGYNENQKREIVDKHFVIELDGEILDPSYCVHNLKDKSYYYNYIDYMNKEGTLTASIKGYEIVKKIAEKMNNNEFCRTNPTYYDNQLDYLMNVNNLLFVI